jgi:hypothetical protein
MTLGLALCQAPEHVEGKNQERLHKTLGFATHMLALAKPPSMSSRGMRKEEVVLDS